MYKGAVEAHQRERSAAHFGYMPDDLSIDYVDDVLRAPNGKHYFAIRNA